MMDNSVHDRYSDIPIKEELSPVSEFLIRGNYHIAAKTAIFTKYPPIPEDTTAQMSALSRAEILKYFPPYGFFSNL